MPIITLLSDFGLKDPYVAEMKAVILSICPEVRIVDISHEVEKFNIRMGALVLASAAPYFPRNTVHLAVVDPGVGTKRRSVIFQTNRSLYVGPDNGLLVLSAQADRIKHVYQITDERYLLPKVSRTFHGRDVFAPAAAHLTCGIKPKAFGTEIKDYVKPSFAEPTVRGLEISGEVLHIDSFGNIITNISAGLLQETHAIEGSPLKVELRRRITTLKLCRAYGEAPAGTPLSIIGSHNFLEISINIGNAGEKFGVKVGEPVKITPMAVGH